MRLADCEKNGWIRPHQTSCEEIKQLLEMVNRDIKDSGQKTCLQTGNLELRTMLHLNSVQFCFIQNDTDLIRYRRIIEQSELCLLF